MQGEKKYIFLDRDGVIIKDKHYNHEISDIEFLPKAIEGLQKLQSIGFQLIIVTNQAGVARNYFSLEEAEKFNDEVVKRLKDKGVEIKASYMCPHHPEFVGECNCRKPKTGLPERAAKEFGIDLSKSIFIGDKDSDIQLGKNCEGKTFLIENNQYETSVLADFAVNSLEEVFHILENGK